MKIIAAANWKARLDKLLPNNLKQDDLVLVVLGQRSHPTANQLSLAARELERGKRVVIYGQTPTTDLLLPKAAHYLKGPLNSKELITRLGQLAQT